VTDSDRTTPSRPPCPSCPTWRLRRSGVDRRRTGLSGEAQLHNLGDDADRCRTGDAQSVGDVHRAEPASGEVARPVGLETTVARSEDRAPVGEEGDVDNG
jgi:hypothetical protein